MLGGNRSGARGSDDHRHLQLDQLICQSRERLRSSLRQALFESHVAALDITEFAKLLSERVPPLHAVTRVEQPDYNLPGNGIGNKSIALSGSYSVRSTNYWGAGTDDAVGGVKRTRRSRLLLASPHARRATQK